MKKVYALIGFEKDKPEDPYYSHEHLIGIFSTAEKADEATDDIYMLMPEGAKKKFESCEISFDIYEFDVDRLTLDHALN